MNTILIIIWLLLGLITLWRTYHGNLKEWYITFDESYWDFDKREGFSAIKFLLYISPFVILGGLISLILWESTGKNNCWWFTTKNK